jgi:hypothetical protein
LVLHLDYAQRLTATVARVITRVPSRPNLRFPAGDMIDDQAHFTLRDLNLAMYD